MKTTNHSKHISLLLRHTKGFFDKNGWATVQSILDTVGITKEELDEIINSGQSDGKRRFEYDEDETHARAVQGHSIEVDLALKSEVPPVILFHGTKPEALKSILKQGLIPMNRQYVHLSKDKETAVTVADRRKGNNIILQVDCKAMYADGHKFYRAKNGVWLSDLIPPKYISQS